MRQPKLFLVLFLVLFLSGRALAQSIRWDPPGGQLGFNQVSELSLVFEGCEPELDQLRLPSVTGLQIGNASTSNQTSIVNGKISQTFSLVFPVRPITRNPITFPSFEIATDKGALRVPTATYTVGTAAARSSGPNISDIASATLTTPKDTFWAGEVFPVSYNLTVLRRYFHTLATNVEWTATPLITEDWTKPDPNEALVRGERQVVSAQSTLAYAKQPGTLNLNPATQMVNLIVGTTGFGLFSQASVEQRGLETNPLKLTIKPLPAAPAGFSGAVGEFSFKSKIVPLNAAVGEPVTWTLELSGTGNWPDITGLPQREVSNDFQIVQPKSKRTMKDNSLFTGTLSEDVVLVPTKPGDYQLAPVSFTYFDPKAGKYQTITSDPVTVTVTAQPAITSNGTGAPIQFSINPAAPAPTETKPLPAAVPPTPPEKLPRDTLKHSATGWAPLRTPSLALICLVSSALCTLLTWLVLAALRSRRTDPQLSRRAAHRELAALLRDSAPYSRPATRDSLLQRWQSAVATLWSLPHAAPTAAAFAAAPEWSRLWTEADRAQHSRDAQLPPDWPARATAALQAVKVPGWDPFSLFAGRNLLPFLSVLLVLSVLSVPATSHAATPATDAYQRGDFSAAEKGFRTALNSAPTDWTTRHNLGLALAQQDRWAEATAYWTGAFLLNSRADETRWDLSLGLQRSGLAPVELVELARGEGRHQLVRLATPGEWQAVLIGASLLLALALILLLLQGYRHIGAWGKPTALTTSLVAMLLAAAATFSLNTYGPLADPAAVIVWKASTLRSIPTEADTTQKTSPLSAGSIALAEKPFLGWTKLTFPAGQTGWVRTEDLIPLYQ